MDRPKPEPDSSRPEPAPPGSVPPLLNAGSKPSRRRKKRHAGRWILLFIAGVTIFAIWRATRPTSPEVPFAGGPRRSFQPGFQPERASRQRNAPRKPKDTYSGPRAALPQFATAGSTFLDRATIELKPGSPNAKIYYTLDGSEPAASSREYSAPFTVAATTLVKAKAFEPNVGPSLTVSQTHFQVDPTLTDFSSKLPLVIISPFGQGIQKQESVQASLRIINGRDKRTALTGPAEYDGRCDIKMRGFSSLRFPKHSFTVKLCEESGEPRKARLLDMPEDSDWVLYAPYSDKTLMRDVLAYELSNKMGRWAARTRFVEVFLNRSGGKVTGRDYLGVYVLEEKIKRSTNRVNIAKLTPQDSEEPAVSGGYIFKRDHVDRPNDGGFGFFNGNMGSPSGEEVGFNTGRGMHLFYVEPKETEITPAQKAWLSRYLNQFEKALYSSNFKNPAEGYARYLDVDSFIDQFWLVELSKNVDGFRYSCYMTLDRNGKIKMEPVWDWNLSFGNANYHQGWTTDNWYWPLLRESEVSWFKRLRNDPEFMQRLTDRWAELRRTHFHPEALSKRIDQMAAELEEAQERNFQRWQIIGQFVNPNWYIGGSYADEVSFMKNWISERIAWIDGQFVSPPVLSRKDAADHSSAKVSMKAPGGTIYYTLDGSDPRRKGGELSPEAREYTESLELQPGTRVFARCKQEHLWSGPAVGTVPAKTAAQ